VKNLRKYGNKPFNVAVIHGGPGAPGEMAPVARELSSVRGILEPLQTAATLEGQVQELKAVLEKSGFGEGDCGIIPRCYSIRAKILLGISYARSESSPPTRGYNSSEIPQSIAILVLIKTYLPTGMYQYNMYQYKRRGHNESTLSLYVALIIYRSRA
jgi:hypothetical protein